MVETSLEDRLVTITLEHWRWEQILLCLDRYVRVLRGEDDALDDIASDAEWANQLDAMAYEFRALVNAGGNLNTPPSQLSETSVQFRHSPATAAEPVVGKPWTAEENAAVIEAYFWMLGEQSTSREYSKVAKYRELIAGPLHIRTRQSIEYKMRNISSVLESHGLTWVQGLKPLSNFQFDLGHSVEEHLSRLGMIDETKQDNQP